jgi:hypothetical protein
VKTIVKYFVAVAMIITTFALTTGCKKDICVTSDYTIINRIESDIVIELKFGDRQVMIIHPGDTQLFYQGVWCRDPKFEPAMASEILNAEMRIDGEVIPRNIWWREHWNIDADVEGDNYSTYTLTVTDELLEAIKNQSTRI